MFDSIYSSSMTASEFFIMAAVSLVAGVIFAWVISLRIRSTKRFFIVAALIPFVVSTVITFASDSIGAAVAIGGAFGLVRFRSAPGSSDEIASILIATSAGIAFGKGYVGYGIIILVLLGIIFFGLAMLPIFEHKSLAREKLLKVTIPESLDYSSVFDDTFAHYLKSFENVGVKTTGMGSMFRLSFKIVMKNPTEEKEFIDELRTKNGNLEISILPYSDVQNQL